jgi:hypothetical protein
MTTATMDSAATNQKTSQANLDLGFGIRKSILHICAITTTTARRRGRRKRLVIYMPNP